MSYITGEVIKKMREEEHLTQRELAERINVSDKAVSKWETGKGLPDLAIVDELSQALHVSIAELLTGDLRMNENKASNMKKMQFYVCPICGNIITAVGQGSYSCCGITLPSAEAEPCDEAHQMKIEIIEDEYVVSIQHSMSKTHYLSFVAYVTDSSCEIVKCYPEQDVCVRFKRKGLGVFYTYCNRHGMFMQKPDRAKK